MRNSGNSGMLPKLIDENCQCSDQFHIPMARPRLSCDRLQSNLRPSYISKSRAHSEWEDMHRQGSAHAGKFYTATFTLKQFFISDKMIHDCWKVPPGRQLANQASPPQPAPRALCWAGMGTFILIQLPGYQGIKLT